MRKMTSKANERRKKNLKLLDDSFRKDIGMVKVSRHETLEHYLGKCLLAWEVLQSGGDFVTEAIFTNGKRADVFNLDTGEALEVKHSEKQESINAKKEVYLVDIKEFNSKDIINFWIKKMNL